jgi:MFS family permease
LVPRLVSKPQLANANALIQTADTLANIAGPALSGILIGEVGRVSGDPLTGLLAGFAVNALLFLGGALVFLRLSRKTDAVSRTDEAETPQEPLGRAVMSGVRYALATPAIRISLMMVALLNFSAIGPIVVGGALLVERRFEGDATLYGFLSGAFGVGMLVGGVLVSLMGTMRRPGMALVYTSAALAIGLIVLGVAPSFPVAFGACLFIGVFGAFTNINAVTLMQVKAAPQMQGRVASLLVFAAVALDPFSNAVSGVLGELNLVVLFCGAGALVAVGAVVAWFNRTLREEVSMD